MASDQSDKTSILILAAAAILIAVVIGVSVVVWQAVGAQTAQQAALAEAARTMQAEQSAAEAAQRVQQSQQLAEAEAKGLKAAEEQIQKLQAELAAERKEKELAIAGEEAIANILVEILQSPNPTRDGRDVKVVELLDKASNQLETDLAEQPKRRAQLQSVLGDSYRSLGLERQAIPLLEKARDYQLANPDLEDPETTAAIESLATSYRNSGRQEEAIKLFEEVLELNRKSLGAEHPKTLEAISNLGRTKRWNCSRRWCRCTARQSARNTPAH
jgi:eukaryotic-like serine/threonine-protein kinase